MHNLRAPLEMPRVKRKLTTKECQERAAVIQTAIKAVHGGQNIRNSPALWQRLVLISRQILEQITAEEIIQYKTF